MKFISPKKKMECKTGWMVSKQTMSIVKCYAEYSGYSEEEVVDTFLKELLGDPKFLDWIERKRYSKRIKAKLFDGENEEINDEDLVEI